MLIKYINKLNVSYFNVYNRCLFLNSRYNLNNFTKYIIFNYSTSNLVHNDKFNVNKLILNNNIIINIKTISNTHKLTRKVKMNTNDWDIVNNYDYVCLNIHEDDISLMKPIIDEKLRKTGKENKIKNYKSIIKQYKEYITILNNVIKYGKRYCLIGLNRRLELANFGNVIMNNKKEIPKLFYLLFRFKNILNDEEGLKELMELCPNTYNFLILGKANHCYFKFLEFLKDVILTHKNDSKVTILVVLETHLKDNLITKMGTNFGLEKIDLEEIESLVKDAKQNISLNSSDNMKNWSLFLSLYLFLPCLILSFIVANLIFYYFYNLKKAQHISISIDSNFNNNYNSNDYNIIKNNKDNKELVKDNLGLRIDSNNRKNRRIKLGKNAKFYDSQRD